MCRKVSSCVLNIVIALIFGTIVGILFGFGILSGIIALWGTFVVGIVGLVIAIGLAVLACCSDCRLIRCCDDKICLLIGAIGTIVTSLVAIAIGGVGIIISAIIAALVGFFVTLTLLSIISVILGTMQCSDRCR